MIVYEIKCDECLCEQWRWGNERDAERMRVTVLFFNASVRYCVPRAPISFPERVSVVSVYVEK